SAGLPVGDPAAGRHAALADNRPVFHAMKDLRPRRLLRTTALIAATAGTIGMMLGVAGGCRRAEKTEEKTNSATVATVPAKSADCQACHADVHKAWMDSHHAKAQRAVDPAIEGAKLAQPQEFSLHGVDYRVEWKDGKPQFTEKRPGDAPFNYSADFILGHTPLLQYLVPIGGGRHQAAELAYDPHRKEWFNVFGDERRRPGEWGHWRGRGMNWNSMCAHCHMTDYRKNYDPVKDLYTTTWREHGVGCFQCHGDLPASHFDPARGPAKGPGKGLTAAEIQRASETCAPCHARNELLTGRLEPGGHYHDFYRLTLPTEANVFYPDGQVRDEDFNYTSLLTSRMGGKAGVTCLDCHEPHSGNMKLPVQDNSICLQCHGPSPRGNAPVIDPVAHSRHLPGSTGNQCVSCHMPTTTYMQRDPRHDHGFLKPDPLLTKELGIPNACNRCHTDKDTDWAIAAADKWYGAKLDSRQRQRTRVVAAARDHLKHTDPLVRSAAVQVLAALPNEAATLRPMLEDPVRLVRLDAAWPLSAELPANSRVRRELDEYLSASADQPAGRMRLGQDFFNRGMNAEAVQALETAERTAPAVADYPYARATILWQQGDRAGARAAAEKALRANPAHPGARQLLESR
ncbi:MAG: multiheme c-type cytochrome, partial [Opitutaceae bacterium]